MDAVNTEKNRRILIIDDNEAVHDDFRVILASQTLDTATLDKAEAAILGGIFDQVDQETFEVDSAFQGQEGLEKIQQALLDDRPYAMAFVDVRMPPGWDGIETIQRIWKEYPDLQVVICTAYSDYEWHEIVKKLGRTEKLLILKKPFEKEEVYQLAVALTEKWSLSKQARLKHKELERIVKQRTRQLEEANRELTSALEEAEKADKAKREFLANMSHEIHTPMNSVIGFSEVLAQEDLTDEQQKYVNLIWRSGKNLMRIIKDILDFSKIEAGELETDMGLDVTIAADGREPSDTILLEPDADKKSANDDTKEIMNWDRLIGRLGDEELIREVVPIFLKDSRERLEKLEEVVKAGDAESVKLYAHAIRGAGRNVGAQSLADCAYDLECAGQEGDMETVEALFDVVRTELEKVVTFLSRTDWMEVAKLEKVITDDLLNATITSR
jgi:CheY-like chemotaxis protein/HPt (histidine-containing phosphotransfer) domain-containing protein